MKSVDSEIILNYFRTDFIKKFDLQSFLSEFTSIIEINNGLIIDAKTKNNQKLRFKIVQKNITVSIMEFGDIELTIIDTKSVDIVIKQKFAQFIGVFAQSKIKHEIYLSIFEFCYYYLSTIPKNSINYETIKVRGIISKLTSILDGFHKTEEYIKISKKYKFAII